MTFGVVGSSCRAKLRTMMGGGIYALSDAARLVAVHPSTLRTWFKPRADRRGRGPLFKAEYDRGAKDYALSFVNLIESRVAYAFRHEGVSLSTLRRAHESLCRQMSTPHPFAHAELRTDGRSVIRRTIMPSSGVELIDAVTRQRLFKEIDELLKGVEYGNDGLAERWNISTGVLIDPSLSLGKPVVKHTAITTYVLANQFEANCRDAGLVADLFDIHPSQVLDAVSFERDLRFRRAA